MTDEGISRRQVLRAASIAGGLGIASGAGTQALLLDEETFSNNSFGAGTLELLVAAKEGATPCSWSPTLEDVRQGGSLDVQLEEKSGSIGLAVAVCDNPGRVTLDVTGMQERSSEPASTSESNGEGMGGDSAESEPEITLVGCDGGEPSPPLASGTLGELVDRDPISLGGERSCRKLGKLENEGGTFAPENDSDAESDPDADDRFVFQNGDDEVIVKIVDRDYKDNGAEVEGINLGVVEGTGLCGVDVKGGNGGEEGNGIKSYSFDCIQETGMLYPPENNGGNQPGVSHVVLYVCEGESRCIDCAPHTVYLEWENLRTTTEVDLELTAKQCRHVDAQGRNS